MSGDGVQTDPDKIEKIKNWPKPNDSDKVRSVMAFAGYYLRFVKDFSKLTKTLTYLLPPTTKKKNKKQLKEWKRETEQEYTDAFQIFSR